MVDVRKKLIELYGNINTIDKVAENINLIHARVALLQIKNIDNFEKGYDEGYPYFEMAEVQRKHGDISKAITLYDKARYNGYTYPALYIGYVRAYRKLKDYDNEYDIASEAIEQYKDTKPQFSLEMQRRRDRALQLKNKNRCK